MNIFEYTDYRTYLKDFYSEQKRRNSAYSFRAFATRARLASPNYLKLVMDGRRRVTDKNMPQFVRGLRLVDDEAEYFRNLVFAQEAYDQEAKWLHHTTLEKIRARKLKVSHELNRDRLEFLTAWYHSAIREMVLLSDFKEDPKWIRERLGGAITEDQAAESLRLLSRLGFIRKVNGRYQLDELMITTSDEVSSVLIKRLHQQFLQLASRSVFEDEMTEREINGLTIAITRAKISEFKNSIKEFRRELNRRFSGADGNQEVYHLVMGFFPLTKNQRKGSHK